MKQGKNDNKKPRIKLDDLPKRNFQQVPEGYFDKLPGEIMAKVSESKKETPVFQIGLNWQTAAIAASITLLLIFSGVFNSTPTKQSAEDILAEVSTEDIMEYLDYSDFSTAEIVATLDIDDADIDDFIENDIQILNESEFESLDDVDLFNEFGIEEQVF